MWCLIHKKVWSSVSVDRDGYYVQHGWCTKCGKAFVRSV